MEFADNQQGAPLVEARNISLTLSVPDYSQTSLRDRFVSWTKNPASSLSKRTTKVVILDNLTFSISKGDRIGILGANGQGKTTLCRCIAGYYTPTQGTIERSCKIRSVFDTSASMYPELTGRENARLLMHFLYPEYHSQFDELLEEAFSFSGLGSKLDLPYRIYSNGMQARLCLSLVSCRPAELLILDEVFDGADSFFREKISQRILSVIEKSGGVVFVSHSFEQINRVCNRVIVLYEHRIVYDGEVLMGISNYLNLHNPGREIVL